MENYATEIEENSYCHICQSLAYCVITLTLNPCVKVYLPLCENHYLTCIEEEKKTRQQGIIIKREYREYFLPAMDIKKYNESETKKCINNSIQSLKKYMMETQ